MYSKPIAYHITWGTYGTRLHGDPRGTVDRDHNQFGEPIIDYDQHRWALESFGMKFDPVRFDPEQMIAVEVIVPPVCERGGWILHACACGPDHVHVLLNANADPKDVRRMMKRWVGQELSKQFHRTPGASWWAECGSTKHVFDKDYFHAALDYVRRQRATPDERQ